MPTTYYWSNEASDLGGGADFSHKLLTSGAVTGTLAVSVAAGATETSYLFTEPGAPGTGGATGDHDLHVDVLTGHANIFLKVSWTRINSAGVAQTTSAQTAEQNLAAGVATFSGTALNLGTWASGDRLRVNLLFRNSNTMAVRSVDISIDDVDSREVAPWSTAVTHATTGALAPTGATIAGSAARTRAHATTGVLANTGAAIVGSAARSGGATTHATTGALAGAGAAVAGSASNFTPHATTGALAGPGGTVAGSAARTRQHPTSGALAGAGAQVVGAAARTRAHASSGVLAGSGAAVVGAAARSGAPVSHATSGALAGAGAAIAGDAQSGASAVVPIGLIPGKRYDPDSYMARLLGPPLEVRLRRELQESLEQAAKEQQPAPKVQRKVKTAISRALSDEDRAAYLSDYTDAWLEFYGALLQRARDEMAAQQEAQRLAQEIELIRLQQLDDEDGEALAALMLML